MSNAFICLVGMATVFIGLICIILLCKLMSLVCGLYPEKQAETKAAPVSTPSASAAITNKQEIVAAVCAAIAEENGTDVKNIRVVSFKRV